MVTKVDNPPKGLSAQEMAERLTEAEFQVEELLESYTKLALAREDQGWSMLAGNEDGELDRQHLVNQAKLHRVFFTANPLVKRGLGMRAAYVFGQGVGVTATNKDVNTLVQDFTDDPISRAVLFGAQAQEEFENLLGTDGNAFVSMVTDRMTGKTTPRMIPFDEITDVITTPGDRTQVRYYLREWSEQNPNTGQTENYRRLYPQLRYDPVTKQRQVTYAPSGQTLPVQWDSPVYHVKVNAQKFQKWGVADCYSAIPWARAYKEFLEDWATLMKSLSKIAWAHYETTSNKKTRRSRRQLSELSDTNAGSVASMGEGSRLEAVPKTGATIDAESGRPLAVMVAAAFGLPITTLLSDPGQTGARAVAETLAQPTRLVMEARQEVHREMRRQLTEYAVLQAIKAPGSPIRGTFRRHGDMTVPILSDGTEVTITVEFPPLDDTPTDQLIDALIKAWETGLMPEDLTLEQLLRALRIRDVDEIIDGLKDAEGRFIRPGLVSGQAAGQAAADRLRRGEDPAGVL